MEGGERTRKGAGPGESRERERKPEGGREAGTRKERAETRRQGTRVPGSKDRPEKEG